MYIMCDVKSLLSLWLYWEKRRLRIQTDMSVNAFDHEDSGLSHESVSERFHNLMTLLSNGKKVGITVEVSAGPWGLQLSLTNSWFFWSLFFSTCSCPAMQFCSSFWAQTAKDWVLRNYKNFPPVCIIIHYDEK